MRIILDTHIFLWSQYAPSRLTKKQRELIETKANTIYVSSISIAEIMIKKALGKLNIRFDPLEAISRSGSSSLDFNTESALLLGSLPLHHKDPFDRMLIAQSIANKYHIMSNDKKFKMYDCKLVH